MDAPQGDVVFRAEGLTKVYHMGDVSVHALRGVDLVLRAGEFVAQIHRQSASEGNFIGDISKP